MSEGYDNTNRGALFKPREGEDSVSLSGSINIDGEDKRVILVKRKSQGGKVYWEMYEKVGQVFRSSSDNPKAPVIHGVVGTIDDPRKRVAGWKQESDRVEGGSFYSLKLEDPQPQDSQGSSNPSDALDDDDIPF